MNADQDKPLATLLSLGIDLDDALDYLASEKEGNGSVTDESPERNYPELHLHMRGLRERQKSSIQEVWSTSCTLRVRTRQLNLSKGLCRTRMKGFARPNRQIKVPRNGSRGRVVLLEQWSMDILMVNKLQVHSL